MGVVRSTIMIEEMGIAEKVMPKVMPEYQRDRDFGVSGERVVRRSIMADSPFFSKFSPSGRETNPAKNLHTFPASADTIHVFQSDTIHLPRPGAADTGGIENESNRNRAPH